MYGFCIRLKTAMSYYLILFFKLLSIFIFASYSKKAINFYFKLSFNEKLFYSHSIVAGGLLEMS